MITNISSFVGTQSPVSTRVCASEKHSAVKQADAFVRRGSGGGFRYHFLGGRRPQFSALNPHTSRFGVALRAAAEGEYAEPLVDLALISSAEPNELRLAILRLCGQLLKASQVAQKTKDEVLKAKDETLRVQGEVVQAKDEVVQAKGEVVQAVIRASEEATKLNKALHDETIKNLEAAAKARRHTFQLLSTASAAHARGVMEFAESQARMIGLVGLKEKDRKKIWSAILSESVSLRNDLEKNVQWTTSPSSTVGVNAADQLRSLYAYLCTHVHFPDIEDQAATMESGILLPGDSSSLTGSYRKALICICDNYCLDWSVVEDDWKISDSSRMRRERRAAQLRASATLSSNKATD